MTKRPVEPTAAVVERMRNNYCALIKRYSMRVTYHPISGMPVLVPASERDLAEAKEMRYVSGKREY